MSIEKAQLVRARFPTFRSLVNLYRSCSSGDDGSLLLHKRIPQISQALSAQVHRFFAVGV